MHYNDHASPCTTSLHAAHICKDQMKSFLCSEGDYFKLQPNILSALARLDEREGRDDLQAIYVDEAVLGIAQFPGETALHKHHL